MFIFLLETIQYNEIAILAKKAKIDLPYSHNMSLCDIEASIRSWINGRSRPYKSVLKR